MAGLCFIFGEEIVKSRKSRQLISESETGEKITRIYFFIFILVVGFSVLVTRLFSLTLLTGNYYKKLATENRIRETKIPAPRGIIYDRNKIPLVRNIPDLFGTTGSTREYIYADVTGNLLGYVGEASGEDLNKLTAPDSVNEGKTPYVIRDIVGKMGIEKIYDRHLRGRTGVEMVEVDATDRYKRTLGRVEAKEGNKLILNIDLKLQKAASELMKGKTGAVVGSDPNSGEILLLYSSPSFDGNKILREEDLNSIFNSGEKPLFNRAVSGLYPPGSTFKIITAISSLIKGAVDRSTVIEDTGVIKVGENYSYANWYFSQYGKTEGAVDLVKAIQRSNDIYFYKAGERTGIDSISETAKKMGAGKKLGIDLDGEEEGLMPDPEWRKKVKGEDWFLGDTYITAIGQGDVLVTPLQVNFWTNVIANNGKLCRPNLNSARSEICSDTGIKKEYIQIIKEGMVKACQTGGTGWPLFNFGVQSQSVQTDGVDFLEAPQASNGAKKMTEVATACKTGTAEFGSSMDKTHAWITVFSPVKRPQISITVLVEEGGEGSSVAGPIARDLLKTWFER